MSSTLVAAMLFTVVLLVVTGYSIMGSAPLLVLKHDTPLDARFVQGFFAKYYLAATLAASATALSYALAGRPVFAAGAGLLVLVALGSKRTLIPRMNSLRERIQLGDAGAIPGFRAIHMTAVLVNLAQLVLIVWSLIALSVQLK